MFAKLFIKEWKEKRFLAVFGMIVVAAYLILTLLSSPSAAIATAAGLSGKAELAEGLAYALLILFFPVLGLLLGSVGFDAEFRDGAWAYLLSRPVGRVTVWLSKYAALVTMLAAAWVLFTGAWLIVPGFQDLVGGLRALLGFGTEFGFPWLSVLASFSLMTLAFSLSILSEKPFNAFLSALIVGLAVSAAAFATLGGIVSGNSVMLTPSKALRTLELVWILTSVAVSVASVMTFRKADFSQPRRKLAKFVPAAAILVLAAFSATAAWAVWGPARSEAFLFWSGAFGGSQYFTTEKGVLRYSGERDKLSWFHKGRQMTFPWSVSNRGWQAYVSYKIKSRTEAEQELWVVNANGSQRRRVLLLDVSRQATTVAPQDIQSWAVSPDTEGRRIAFIADEGGARPHERRIGLWIVNSDGTGLERLPVDPAIGLGSLKASWVRLTAWSEDGTKLLIYQRGMTTQAVSKLWLYDLGTRTAAPAVNSDSVGFCVPSPDGNFVSVPYRSAPDGPIRLGLLDLRTMALTDLDVGGTTRFTRLVWSGKGDKFIYTAQRKDRIGADGFVWQVYDVTARKLIGEREAGRDERTVLMGVADWMMGDGQIARLDVSERAVKIMTSDLRDVKSVPLPERIINPTGLYAAGDKIVVQDNASDSLWRYDTARDSWKKIY